MSNGGSLPVVVRVKRKRELAPVDTIVVEAEETPAAKRRARDAALAAELDAALAGAFGTGSVPEAGSSAAASDRASVQDPDAGRTNRRRFQRVKMTLSVAEARDAGRVRELVQTVMATSSRKRSTIEPSTDEINDDPSKPSSTAAAAAAKAPPPKRATTLRRPAPAGVGSAGDETPDAMCDYFRMYDLEAGGEGEDPTESGARGEPSLKRPTPRPAVRGDGATSNAAPAPRRDDDDENDEAKASRLMCDYMPMVREYLGESPAKKTPEDDEDDGFVYDVYVQCADDDVDGDGDDPASRDGFLAGDSSAVFVGGMDTALFFDAMDGLMDDEVDDDVDSQDSNREDAPDADYPEDESDESWDEDEDDDGYGGRRGGGGGFDWYAGDGEDVDGLDGFDEHGGYGRARVAEYGDVAYDSDYDDERDDGYY